MALNDAWLFGIQNVSESVTNINSFSIASNGALQQVSQINATSYNPYDSGGPTSLFLDHTGATLYDGDTYAYGTGSNAYQAFTIDQSTGQLNFLQLGPDGGVLQGSPMSFTGSNKYMYSSACYEGSPGIFGYQRNSDGTMTSLNINPKIPAAQGTGNYYWPLQIRTITLRFHSRHSISCRLWARRSSRSTRSRAMGISRPPALRRICRRRR